MSHQAVALLLGGAEASPVARTLVKYWRYLYAASVFLLVLLPSLQDGAWRGEGAWLGAYLAYAVLLQAIVRGRGFYDGSRFRVTRISLDLVFTVVLHLVAPDAVAGYGWILYLVPLVAVLVYFDSPRWFVGAVGTACVLLIVTGLHAGGFTLVVGVDLVAKCLILAAASLILRDLATPVPKLREDARALLVAATTFLQVMERKDFCQLIADAVKEALPTADAAVVHLLGGTSGEELIPQGSSSINPISLGRTPMQKGVGIAGHAIAERRTINVADVEQDSRFHDLPPATMPFRSLMVVPMYVGDKDIGTISVHSDKVSAFGPGVERLLKTLGAQGSLALANAELYTVRGQRREMLSQILQASRSFSATLSFAELLHQVAEEVCRCTLFRMAAVNLIDTAEGDVVVEALAGVPEEGLRKLAGQRIPVEVLRPLLKADYRVSDSYLIRHDQRPDVAGLDRYTFTSERDKRRPGGWHPGEWHPLDMLLVPMRTQDDLLVGYISVDAPEDGSSPSYDMVQSLELLASLAATAIDNARLFQKAQREVAERRRAEESLAQEQARLQTFMDNVDDHIYFKDVQSRFIRINPAMARWFGLDNPSQAIGKTDHDIFTGRHAEQALTDEIEVMQTGVPKRVVERETWADGRETWVLTAKFPWYDAAGKIQGTYGVSRDITEQVRRDNRRLEIQATLTGGVTQHTSLEGLGEYLVQTGTRFIGAQDCTLFLDGQADGVLRVLATTLPAARADSAGVAGTAPPSVADVAARGPECLDADDLADHPLWSGHLWCELSDDGHCADVHSLLAVPLTRGDGTCIGCLVARNAQRGRGFTEFDQELMMTLARHAVVGVDRIRDLGVRIDAERSRLETDLHTAMNMLATGVKWEAEIAIEELEEGNLDETSEAMDRMFRAYQGAYAELTYVLEDLRDPVLERNGLVAALEKKAELIAPGHVLVVSDLDRRLAPDLEGDLYRVGVEGMNNAAKHSGIKNRPDGRITVHLSANGDEVVLRVTDNGAGFDVAEARQHKRGWGLRRLNGIIENQGGKLDVRSEPGGGTTLLARVDRRRAQARIAA